MGKLRYLVLWGVLMALVACAGGDGGRRVTPTPTGTPTPAPTPTRTSTPTPTPTPTPIPPLALTLLWPEVVPVLPPVSVAVALAPPPGVQASPVVSATVLDPQGVTYDVFELRPQVGDRYAAPRPLRLPLTPAPGYWWLIVHVGAELDVRGEHVRFFSPMPVAYRALTGTLPSGVTLQVPELFAEVMAQGDPWAGARAWRYEAGEVALWWAPGPAEPLEMQTALVMLEATHDPEAPPEVHEARADAWGAQTAFWFQETWPGDRGGPAEAWVIQGPDRWLYVLRVRGLGREIPYLMREVAATFAFVEP